MSGIGVAALFAVAAIEVVHGNMTAGEAISATTLAALVFAPIARLADLTSLIERAATSFDRDYPLLIGGESETQIVNAAGRSAISTEPALITEGGALGSGTAKGEESE